MDLINPKIISIHEDGDDVIQAFIDIDDPIKNANKRQVNKLENYGRWHQTTREAPQYHGQREKETLSNLLSRYIAKEPLKEK